MNILKKIKTFIFGPSPLDCLLIQLDLNNLHAALEEDEKQFYRESFQKDHTKKDYIKEMHPIFREKSWNPFIQKLQQEDELWIFRYPDKYWKKLAGRQGFVILRNGKIVDTMMTKCN